MTILKAALKYREIYKFSIIPVTKDKRPYIKWEKYQNELSTIEEINDWFKKWPEANLAVVTGKVSGIAVIDIDTKEGMEAIQKYIPDNLKIPIVKTPNGTHLYFKNPFVIVGNNVKVISGCDYRGEKGYIILPPSINKHQKKYRWADNLGLKQVALPDLPEKYLKKIQDNSYSSTSTYNNCKNDATNAPLATTSDNKRQHATLFMDGRRDNDIFHVANCLVKGGMREDIAMQVLEIVAQKCQPPFAEKDVKVKIGSAIKRAEDRERNIAEEVREWVGATKGDFDTTKVYLEATMSDNKEKRAARKALERLCKEGVIERNDKKAGHYRIVNLDVEKIDFVNASDKVVDISWPLHLERFFITHPKNIIVIAGSPDSGKTAFLLNFVRKNMSHHKIRYLSSEMGDSEFRDRLSKFDDISLKEWTFEALEKSSDWWDVIDPDNITIIDYMEIHDNFYQIGQWFKNCFDKLKRGICIIAIQKNPKADMGRGGIATLEKPRLAINLDYNVATIAKAKNWVNAQINPKGMQCKFKLVQGCKFIIEEDWHKNDVL